MKRNSNWGNAKHWPHLSWERTNSYGHLDLGCVQVRHQKQLAHGVVRARSGEGSAMGQRHLIGTRRKVGTRSHSGRPCGVRGCAEEIAIAHVVARAYPHCSAARGGWGWGGRR